MSDTDNEIVKVINSLSAVNPSSFPILKPPRSLIDITAMILYVTDSFYFPKEDRRGPFSYTAVCYNNQGNINVYRRYLPNFGDFVSLKLLILYGSVADKSIAQFIQEFIKFTPPPNLEIFIIQDYILSNESQIFRTFANRIFIPTGCMICYGSVCYAYVANENLTTYNGVTVCTVCKDYLRTAYDLTMNVVHDLKTAKAIIGRNTSKRIMEKVIDGILNDISKDKVLKIMDAVESGDRVLAMFGNREAEGRPFPVGNFMEQGGEGSYIFPKIMGFLTQGHIQPYSDPLLDIHRLFPQEFGKSRRSGRSRRRKSRTRR